MAIDICMVCYINICGYGFQSSSSETSNMPRNRIRTECAMHMYIDIAIHIYIHAYLWCHGILLVMTYFYGQ